MVSIYANVAPEKTLCSYCALTSDDAIKTPAGILRGIPDEETRGEFCGGFRGGTRGGFRGGNPRGNALGNSRGNPCGKPRGRYLGVFADWAGFSCMQLHYSRMMSTVSTVLAQDHFYSDFLSLRATIESFNSATMMISSHHPSREVTSTNRSRVDDFMGVRRLSGEIELRHELHIASGFGEPCMGTHKLKYRKCVRVSCVGAGMYEAGLCVSIS